MGPGAKKEAQLLGLGLIKLRSKQKDWLADAKKYAKEQSIKQVLLRQTVAHQQNVICSQLICGRSFFLIKFLWRGIVFSNRKWQCMRRLYLLWLVCILAR